MTTWQLVIVCVFALLALGLIALLVFSVLDSKESIAQKRLDGAVVADHLGSTVAGDLAGATAALEALTDELQVRLALAERGPSLTGKSLVVHTRKPDDQSVRGVVDAHYADRLVLREAQYLHASGAQPAGGVVDVPLINVSTWQEIQPPAADQAAG